MNSLAHVYCKDVNAKTLKKRPTNERWDLKSLKLYLKEKEKDLIILKESIKQTKKEIKEAEKELV